MNPPQSGPASQTTLRRSKRPSRKPDEWWTSKKAEDRQREGPGRSVSKRPRSPVAEGPRKRHAYDGVLDSPNRGMGVIDMASRGGVVACAGPSQNSGFGACGAVPAKDVASDGGRGRTHLSRGVEVETAEGGRQSSSVNPPPSPVTPWEEGGSTANKGDIAENTGEECGELAREDAEGIGRSPEACGPATVARSSDGGAKEGLYKLDSEGDAGDVVGYRGERSAYVGDGALGGKQSTEASNGGGSICAAAGEDGSGSMNVDELDGAAAGDDRSDVEMSGSNACPRNRPQAAFARSSDLRFQKVQGVDGAVSVAIALSVNNSYTGLLEVPPLTNTGAQRALKGDEFFLVESGHVYMDVGDTRHMLQAGDHVAVPHMSCYSFENSSPTACRLVFFVPCNPFG